MSSIKTYTYACSHPDCDKVASYYRTTKAKIEAHLRKGALWMKSKGQWYCADHRPFAAHDKAPLFAENWRLLAWDVADKYRYIPRYPVLGVEVDFCFVREKVIVEVDGGQFAPMGGRHNSDKDRRKINLLTAAGYRVLRFSVQMLEKDPDGCIDQTRALLDWVNRDE